MFIGIAQEGTGMGENRLKQTVQGLERLKDLFEGGMNKAAEALSMMVGKEIHLQTVSTELRPISVVPCLAGDPEEAVAAAYLMVEGNLAGHVMLFFSFRSVLSLMDMLLDLPEGSTKELGELEQSALGEAGNVMGSAFLNNLSEATTLCCRPSPPAVIVDMAGAVLSIILVEAARYGDDVLTLETVFSTLENQVKGYFWVVPTPNLLSIIEGNDPNPGAQG